LLITGEYIDALASFVGMGEVLRKLTICLNVPNCLMNIYLSLLVESHHATLFGLSIPDHTYQMICQMRSNKRITIKIHANYFGGG
jgi:hypothetical protein